MIISSFTNPTPETICRPYRWLMQSVPTHLLTLRSVDNLGSLLELTNETTIIEFADENNADISQIAIDTAHRSFILVKLGSNLVLRKDFTITFNLNGAPTRAVGEMGPVIGDGSRG